MNYSIAVLLLNSNIQLVACSYEPSTTKDVPPSTTLFKTFKKDLKIGDYVTVPTNTRHGYTVVRVEKVGVQLDPHTQTKIEWLVEQFDVRAHDKLLALENIAIEKVKGQEAKRQAAELRKTMGLDDPEISGLAIANTIDGEAVALPPPASGS